MGVKIFCPQYFYIEGEGNAMCTNAVNEELEELEEMGYITSGNVKLMIAKARKYFNS